MQKVINVLAVASAVVSVAVVGTGAYVFVNKDAIVDGVKSKVMEAVLPSLGGGITDAIPEMTGPAAPIAPSAGLGLPVPGGF